MFGSYKSVLGGDACGTVCSILHEHIWLDGGYVVKMIVQLFGVLIGRKKSIQWIFVLNSSAGCMSPYGFVWNGKFGLQLAAAYGVGFINHRVYQ